MRPARRLSIRTRLALIYTGLLAAGLIVFGTGVFLTLRQELDRSFDARLLASAEHAAGAFAQDIDTTGNLRPTERLVEQLASTGGRVIVFDQNRAVLADSALPGTSVPPLAATDFADADAHAHAIRGFGTAEGDSRRIHRPGDCPAEWAAGGLCDVGRLHAALG